MKILKEISEFLKLNTKITDYNVEERIKVVNKMNKIAAGSNFIVLVIHAVLFFLIIKYAKNTSIPMTLVFFAVCFLSFIYFSIKGTKIVDKLRIFKSEYDYYIRKKADGHEQKEIVCANTSVYLIKEVRFRVYSTREVPYCTIEEYIVQYEDNTTTTLSIKHNFDSVLIGTKFFDEYTEKNGIEFINKMNLFIQNTKI